MSKKENDAVGCASFVFGVLCAMTAWRLCALGPPWLSACAPLAAGLAWVLGVCVFSKATGRDA